MVASGGAGKRLQRGNTGQLLKVIGEAGIDAETLNQTVKAVNAGLSQEERRKSYEEYGETF